MEFGPWHVAVNPGKFGLLNPLAEFVHLHVRLMVAKAYVINRGVVHDIHDAICLVQAGEQAGGNKVPCQNTYAIWCPGAQYKSILVFHLLC